MKKFIKQFCQALAGKSEKKPETSYILAMGSLSLNRDDGLSFHSFYKEYDSLKEGYKCLLYKTNNDIGDIYYTDLYVFIATRDGGLYSDTAETIKQLVTGDKELFKITKSFMASYAAESDCIATYPRDLVQEHLGKIKQHLNESLDRCDVREPDYSIIRKKWNLVNRLAADNNIDIGSKVVVCDETRIAIDLSQLDTNELSLTLESPSELFWHCVKGTLPDTATTEAAIKKLCTNIDGLSFYEYMQYDLFMKTLNKHFEDEVRSSDTFTSMVCSVPFEQEMLQRTIAWTDLSVDIHHDERAGVSFTVSIGKAEGGKVIANSAVSNFDFNFSDNAELAKLYSAIVQLQFVVKSLYRMYSK